MSARRVFRISGKDRVEFLQNLVTNDVKRLDTGLVWTALLTPQGKYLADFFLVPEGEAILLIDGKGRHFLVKLQRGTQFTYHLGSIPHDELIGRQDGTTVVTSSGDLPLPFICGFRGRTCRTGWAVWEIDPDTGSAAEILAGNGERIAGVPVALEVGDFLLLGSIGDNRVGVFRRR